MRVLYASTLVKGTYAVFTPQGRGLQRPLRYKQQVSQYLGGTLQIAVPELSRRECKIAKYACKNNR